MKRNFRYFTCNFILIIIKLFSWKKNFFVPTTLREGTGSEGKGFIFHDELLFLTTEGIRSVFSSPSDAHVNNCNFPGTLGTRFGRPRNTEESSLHPYTRAAIFRWPDGKMNRINYRQEQLLHNLELLTTLFSFLLLFY